MSDIHMLFTKYEHECASIILTEKTHCTEDLFLDFFVTNPV